VALSGARDVFYLVDKIKDLLKTSVDYYPVTHSRDFGVHFRALKITSSPRVYTNQFVTGNQRGTVILK
jgi:hypothetical protein